MPPPSDPPSDPSLDRGPGAAAAPGPGRVTLPAVPAVAAGPRGAVVFSPDGRLEDMALTQAARRVPGLRPMVCHLPALAARLDVPPFPACDLLELFAFVHPARFCLPTVRGLADALDLERPRSVEEEARTLVQAARRLLLQLMQADGRDRSDARGIVWAVARTLGPSGWGWTTPILAALGLSGDTPHRLSASAGLRVWERLPRWEDQAPEPAPGNQPVEPLEARQRLARMLGPAAEERPQQADYASAAAAGFAPRETVGSPNVVLAEAGTGVGKTLGYIAPASVWAEKNKGTVWISTFTRNLQRQLDGELNRLYPDPAEKARRVVVRKGRENYLCLLNMEEAVQRVALRPMDVIGLGLTARWALRSRDGDMGGGDFPGWLPDVAGRAVTLGLTDRRGECIHTACPHYQRCPIERTARRARRASIVVANHALAMIQAALGGLDDGSLPVRYVFDEGHHLFDAADSAFSAHLSGLETSELRRWLLGGDGDPMGDGPGAGYGAGRGGGRQGRSRGLRVRAEDVVAGDDPATAALEDLLSAARALPAPGWTQRLAVDNPGGPAERFLLHVRSQVYARAPGPDSPYSLETEVDPPVTGLREAAQALDVALKRIGDPLLGLLGQLGRRLEDPASELDASQRQRIDALMRSLERRALLPVAAWRSMLAGIGTPAPPEYVDWISIDRSGGREVDIGMHRHWIDPTIPFAAAIAESAHGFVITSATLRDGSGDVEADWRAAERRTGAVHLPRAPLRAEVPSPFDYPRSTRVFIVTDVRKDALDQVAGAYQALFLAAGGGGLGVFTAISRLKAVHARIAAPLDEAGILLLAQHVDGLDTATLVDIFRAEEDACLLGTDAVRDGVDVPGRSLRLLVFDRVPWPRPDILHKARRAAHVAAGHGSARSFDDRVTRLRLKQAFGRLVRRAGDVGVFVLLDPMMPSRLAGAFPPGVPVTRAGLAETVREIGAFLATPAGIENSAR